MTDTTQAAGLTDVKKLTDALEAYATAVHARAQGNGSSSECHRLYNEVIRAALAAQAVPAGYKLVPVEPTSAMLLAAHQAAAKLPNALTWEVTTWNAMLAASPAPAEAKEEPKPHDPPIEYRYEGGTHWCPLGPAERMKPDFKGVYRLAAGKYPVEPTPQPQAAQPVAMTDERMSLISRLKAQSVAHRYEAETDSADLIDEGVAALSAMTDLLEEARDTIAKLLIKIRRDAPDSAGRLLGYADQVVARVDAALDSPLSAQAAPKVPEAKRCEYCDGTGDVHSIDGQWRGECTACKPEAKAQAVPMRRQVVGVRDQITGSITGAWSDEFAPQPPAPSEPELVYCKYCQGSGESTHVVGRGPDAHDEPCNCDKCGGTGVFQAGRIVDVGLLEYRGNSVAHIHARMTAYWSVLDAAWEALKKAGIRPDGNTSVAMAIERLAAPSEQRKPLTWNDMNDSIPPKGTDCLVLSQEPWEKAPTVKLDRWDEIHEAPVSFSSATIYVGDGWVEDHTGVTHWMPVPALPEGIRPTGGEHE